MNEARTNITYADVNRMLSNVSAIMNGQVIVTDDFSDTLNYAFKNASVLTKAPETPKAPEGAKTVLRVHNGKLVADICKDNTVRYSKDILPDITDVSIVEASGVKKVVFIKFADGTTQKAVLSDDDTFSLEQGISVCITKKLLDMKAGNGSSLYNKVINRAVKVYNNAEKAKAKQIKEASEKKAKAEKVAAKKRAKRLKREAEARETQIEIQKEAYLRAMRENNNTSRDVAGWE